MGEVELVERFEMSLVGCGSGGLPGIANGASLNIANAARLYFSDMPGERSGFLTVSGYGVVVAQAKVKVNNVPALFTAPLVDILFPIGGPLTISSKSLRTSASLLRG